MSIPNRTLKANLRFRDDMQLGDRVGFWVPRCSVQDCIQCIIDADERASSPVHYYLLPDTQHVSGEAISTVGLVALPTNVERLAWKDRGIPLVAAVELPSKQSLWKQIESHVSPELSLRQWIATLPGVVSDSRHRSDETDGIADAWLWLPHHGLVVLEAADRVTLEDLLKPPTNSQSWKAWKAPPQPAALPERIAGFEIWPSPKADDMLQDLASDFGQQAGELGDIKPDKKGPSGRSSLASLKDKAQAWVLRKADKLFGGNKENDEKNSKEPSGKKNTKRSNSVKESGWFRRRSSSGRSAFKGISAGLYERLSRAVEGQREKQLQNLLDMAKNNPDEALKYAIPLAGSEPFRGLAVPGDRLLSQIPDYRFPGSGSGSSGLADFWQMSSQLQQELRAAYLQMANREVAAGRFRRAAYVHANLLDDQTAAASVLEQGCFYHEAAQIYGEKLNNKPEQARCLLAAGMHEQAIKIFLERNDYLSAAEAWESVERIEDAQREYRREVSKRISNQRILPAVNLLEEKLDAREEAKQLLWQQWPNGCEIVPATHRYFQMLFADGEFDKAEQRLSEAVELAANDHVLDLAVLCQQVAGECPHRRMQLAAQDACRVAVAQYADHASPLQMDRVTSVIQQLDPNDRLLANDAVRFRQQWRKNNERPVIKRPNERARKDAINRRTPLLLEEESCVSFRRVGDSLVVVADHNTHLSVTRYLSPDSVSPRGAVSRALSEPTSRTNARAHALRRLDAQFAVASRDNCIFDKVVLNDVLTTGRHNSASLFLWIEGSLNERVDRSLYESMGHPQHVKLSSRVPTALKNCQAMTMLDDDSWAGIRSDGLDWSLLTCAADSSDLRNRSLARFIHTVDEDSLGHPGALMSYQVSAFLQSMGGITVAAIGDQVIVGAETSSPWATRAGGHVMGIATGPPNTRKRIAIAHSNGLEVVWPGIQSQHIAVCRNRSFRHALWMQGGRLFAISDDWLFRFHIRNEQVVSEASVQLMPDPIISLVELSAGVCGVCYRSGIVDRF